MEYVRVCEGLSDKGKLIPKNDVYAFVGKKINHKDFYVSKFIYNDKHKEQFETSGSVAGILDVLAKSIFFDFDSKENVQKALDDARTATNRLRENGVKDSALKIFFSGKKGFEIGVDFTEEFTPTQVKNVCLNLAGDLETLDTQIYNASRIFRLPLSKHQDTKLFKIPLTVDELMTLSVEDIKEAAKVNFTPDDIAGAWEEIELPQQLKEVKDKTIELKPETVSFVVSDPLDLSDIPFDRKPKGMPNSLFVISQGGFESGERHNAILHLATYFKNEGMSDEEIHMECKKAAVLQAKRTGSESFNKKEIWKIVKSLQHWKGGIYTDNNSPLLAKIAQFMPTTVTSQKYRDLKSVADIAKEARAFVMNIDKNRIKTGLAEFDDAIDMLVGRVYVIAGSPGSGKSSLLLQIFEGLSAQNITAIYFSFDMSLNDNFQKLVQKEFKITAKDYFEQAKDETRFNEFQDKIAEKYKNIIFVDSSGMSVDEMTARIEYYEGIHGEIKVVAVDYMALIKSDKSDSNEHSKAVIQGLKAIATEKKKCVISLNQPNKANQKINEPLSGYGGIAGSAELQNLANVICWIYRPGAAPDTFEDDKYYTVDILKNRHGALGSLTFRWFGITGTVRSLTAVERMDLQTLKERLKEEKKGERDF